MVKPQERKIAFIGPPGSGKSVLASEYAAQTGMRRVDTDELFTSRYGDIKAFFQAHGEAAFREKESEIIVSATRSDASVIACGGGAVLCDAGMAALRAWGDIVLLTADTDVLAARIAQSNRPLKSVLNELVESRAPLYKKYADYTLDTSKTNVENYVRILRKILIKPRANRYDVLLCDADETVLDFKKAMRTAVVNAIRTFGVTAADDLIVEEYGKITDEVWSKLERKQITRAELDKVRFVMLGERLGEKFDTDAANTVYIDEMRKTRFVLDGALEFLRRVRARGIKVYIVTNSFLRIASERLKALDGCIDGAFISESIGVDKPDARFFERALRGIDADKSRIMVFGDSESADIAGGINAGLDTCLYDVGGSKSTAALYKARTYEDIYALL